MCEQCECAMMLGFDTMIQTFWITGHKALLVIGIFLQIFSCIMSLVSEKIMNSNARSKMSSNVHSQVRNKNIACMINTGSVRRLLLFIGTLFVSLVAFLESDYILFVAQFLLFIVLYPRK